MPREAEVIRYEDAAHYVQVEGWACKTCRRWYGKNEHMARWCCATDLPCDCGGRRSKTYTCCKACRDAAADDRWAARERKTWQGEPLYSETLSRYLFDGTDILDALEDLDREVDPEELRLLFCRPCYAQEIDLETWIDILPDDGDLDDLPTELLDAVEEANKVIRGLQEGTPVSWAPGTIAAELPPDWRELGGVYRDEDNHTHYGVAADLAHDAAREQEDLGGRGGRD